MSTSTASHELYTTVNSGGERIYKGDGLSLPLAVNMAARMPARCAVARIESDGTLTAGRVRGVGERAQFIVA